MSLNIKSILKGMAYLTVFAPIVGFSQTNLESSLRYTPEPVTEFFYGGRKMFKIEPIFQGLFGGYDVEVETPLFDTRGEATFSESVAGLSFSTRFNKYISLETAFRHYTYKYERKLDRDIPTKGTMYIDEKNSDSGLMDIPITLNVNFRPMVFSLKAEFSHQDRKTTESQDLADLSINTVRESNAVSGGGSIEPSVGIKQRIHKRGYLVGRIRHKVKFNSKEIITIERNNNVLINAFNNFTDLALDKEKVKETEGASETEITLGYMFGINKHMSFLVDTSYTEKSKGEIFIDNNREELDVPREFWRRFGVHTQARFNGNFGLKAGVSAVAINKSQPGTSGKPFISPHLTIMSTF